jgi:hypothetical protein
MPSIVSGINSKATKPKIRKIASIDALSIPSMEKSQQVGQMTPGKRKASDMYRDNGVDLPLSETMPSADGFGLPYAGALLEDSPRVKRMRMGSGQFGPNNASEVTLPRKEGKSSSAKPQSSM